MAVLEAQERVEEKHSALRGIREQGNIPAVLYGKNVKSKTIFISQADLVKTVRESGRSGLITLKVNGETHSALLRDIQKDPDRKSVV